MAKSIAKSCPLCLSVNDPVDMLPVTMEHSTPPQTAPLYLCRLCVIQIMKATLQSDVVDPREVFGEVSEPTEDSAVTPSPTAEESKGEAAADSALQRKADDARAEWLKDQDRERKAADENDSEG